MGKRPISEILDLIDDARRYWTFTEDPGPGTHPFGDRYQLRISDHEIKKNETTRRYLVELVDEPGHPLTLSYGWEGFHENLSQPSKIPRYTAPEEEFDMTKMSIHDDELREKVRLKCKNDWDLELNEDQVTMCIIEMEEQKLSIFHDQIWPNKRRWNKKDDRGGWTQMERLTWDKSIDGYRAMAHRSGRFAGMEAAVFEHDENGDLIARITVYALDRKGKRHSYVGEARYNEFVQLVDEWVDRKKTGKKVPNNQWGDKPYNMLSIAAERQALRKAFQETDDDQAEAEDLTEGQEPEERGQETPLPPSEEPAAPQGAAAPPPPPPSSGERPKPSVSRGTPSTGSAGSEKSKGKYVGIPKAGFRAGQMYNKEERIVMLGQKGGINMLALDSGEKVQVNAEGHEIDRSKRTDKFKGGRKWSEGDVYYDETTVEKVADSKKDEWSLWLALDNGFKVCVNRWGKEAKRKERKKGKKSGAKNSDQSSAPPSSPPPTAPPSQPQPEADAPGKGGKVDPETVTTVELMRKITTPLLKKWCDEVYKKRVNPKQAYEQFTGVVLGKGQPMSLDDYKVLYQCLEEALDDAAAAK